MSEFPLYLTAPSPEVAARIAGTLAEERLAACLNMIARSHPRFDGGKRFKIVHGP